MGNIVNHVMQKDVVLFYFIGLSVFACSNIQPIFCKTPDISFIYKGKQYFKFPRPCVDDKDIDYVSEVFSNKDTSIYQRFLCLWHYMCLSKNATFPKTIEIITEDLRVLFPSFQTVALRKNLSDLSNLARNCVAFFYKNEKLIQCKQLPKELQKKTMKVILLCNNIASQLDILSKQLKVVYNACQQTIPATLTQYINNGAILYRAIAKSLK